ncbi:RagB/SusD family nutrient uptake outer membrane protein [Flavobacterium sp. ST-119]|uniref:RagB/SusD family nutrient uptake outer membrane protein n=2 Tax=Flavobacterium rhizosphaerae TaxID=3163298 RepID=A0ABW8YTE6_9FLAO
MSALLAVGCSKDILDETPRATYTPEFFRTEEGVNGGVTGFYAHLRQMYGQAYYYNTCETGTDEATYAQSADGNFKDMDMSGVGQITPSTSRTDAIWGECFRNINSANGVLEYGAEAGASASLLAEANFFRAFDYFLLVQTFGGVPLDLGSGELAFNTTPSTESTRNTVPEVYTKAIFPDLMTAIENLPDAPRLTGTVTKTVARLYLAKAYLTYGWWLQNPNNIPTYPETTRTDPDGHDAQWYFQHAYDMAMEGINNPGGYSLQPTYYDVNVAENDRNSEIMLYADHTEESAYYNGGDLNYGSGGAPDNFAGWMMTWNYTNLKSAEDPAQTTLVNSVQREAAQPLGRPWTRMCPTIEVVTNTFANKVDDSRYDGTFTTTYRGNWPKGGVANDVLYNANSLPVYPGDAILTFLDEEPAQAVDYSPNISNIGAGKLPGRADWVINPQGISRLTYPGLWKLGPYRTDNADGLGQPNAGSTRPFNIAKFSEFYFVAAEAAVKGATGSMSARDLINVIRARAGMWRFDNNANEVRIEDHSAEMTAATPAVIDVDYILDELSREYYGEGHRWFDLVRTQKWGEKAATYTICGSALYAHTPETFQRTIETHFYLRPIPQGQIDAMTGDKAAYQNPGYN